MAQTITNVAASRVNRRFLLLAFILGLLAAVLIYAQLSRSSSGGGGAAGDVPAVVAKVAIPPGTRITSDMVEVRQLSQSAVGAGVLSTAQQAIDQVARYPIAAGEQVLASKIVATTVPSNAALSYILEAGKRGMAIKVEEVTDAGGLVLPGDHVDIVWLPFKGAPAFVLLSDVEVTAVSQTIVDVVPSAPGLSTGQQDQPAVGQRTRNSDAKPIADATTVTLMITPTEAAMLLCAETYANKFEGALRLAVRAFGDTAAVAPNAPVCPPVDLFAQLGGK